MNFITIPEHLIKEKELVLISKRKLEELIKLSKKTLRALALAPAQKRALACGRKNKKAGRFLTFDELKTKLGVAN